jgi:hypothetical protein
MKFRAIVHNPVIKDNKMYDVDINGKNTEIGVLSLEEQNRLRAPDLQYNEAVDIIIVDIPEYVICVATMSGCHNKLAGKFMMVYDYTLDYIDVSWITKTIKLFDDEGNFFIDNIVAVSQGGFLSLKYKEFDDRTESCNIMIQLFNIIGEEISKSNDYVPLDRIDEMEQLQQSISDKYIRDFSKDVIFKYKSINSLYDKYKGEKDGKDEALLRTINTNKSLLLEPDFLIDTVTTTVINRYLANIEI